MLLAIFVVGNEIGNERIMAKERKGKGSARKIHLRLIAEVRGHVSKRPLPSSGRK